MSTNEKDLQTYLDAFEHSPRIQKALYNILNTRIIGLNGLLEATELIEQEIESPTFNTEIQTLKSPDYFMEMALKKILSENYQGVETMIGYRETEDLMDFIKPNSKPYPKNPMFHDYFLGAITDNYYLSDNLYDCVEFIIFSQTTTDLKEYTDNLRLALSQIESEIICLELVDHNLKGTGQYWIIG